LASLRLARRNGVAGVENKKIMFFENSSDLYFSFVRIARYSYLRNTIKAILHQIKKFLKFPCWKNSLIRMSLFPLSEPEEKA